MYACLRPMAAAALALTLSGCLGTGFLGGDSADPAPTGAIERRPVLLIATTRQQASPPDRDPWFTGSRGQGLGYTKARLAGPDRSLIGKMTSAVSGDWDITEVGLLKKKGAAAAFAEATMGRDVLLYIHGYKESFRTAAVNAAELSGAIAFQGASGIFSWPSNGATFDYGYDRESALWSRDALEELLRALANSPSGGRIHIVAHSMGTLLTLETLRTLRAEGGDAVMAKIGALVLAAPDIDFDLFASGVRRLGPDAAKITVISSVNDRALGLSRRIAGGVVRAGGADREKLEALGLRVADASDYGSGLLNHDLFLTNREVQQVVRRAIDRAGG